MAKICKNGHLQEGANVSVINTKRDGWHSICKICADNRHLKFRRAHGIIEKGSELETDLFDKYVNKTETCWLWTGQTAQNGYGRFDKQNRIKIAAHVYNYIRFKGEYAYALEIDHTCTIKNCVNPEHLEAVTSRENKLRYHRRAKHKKALT